MLLAISGLVDDREVMHFLILRNGDIYGDLCGYHLSNAKIHHSEFETIVSTRYAVTGVGLFNVHSQGFLLCSIPETVIQKGNKVT